MILETVQAVIFARVNADATLKSLLGGNDRIRHGMEPVEPMRNSISYAMAIGTPGRLQADNVQSEDQYYEFTVFSDRYNDIVKQLRILLDRFRLPATADAGPPIGVLDWVGPDDFDEGLKCGKKQIRFRFFVIAKPQGPV